MNNISKETIVITITTIVIILTLSVWVGNVERTGFKNELIINIKASSLDEETKTKLLKGVEDAVPKELDFMRKSTTPMGKVVMTNDDRMKYIISCGK